MMAFDMTAQLAPIVWSLIAIAVITGLSLFAAHDTK